MKQCELWLLVLFCLLSCSISLAAEPLEVVNGDFDLPGDTWMTGGGVPDAWTIENHTIEKGAGGANGTHGTVGLNHRWNPLKNSSGRSLYLMNPQGAIVRQELKGTMVARTPYKLRYGYFRYGRGQATITARLKTGDRVLASQTFAGEEFPFQKWQEPELSYTAVEADDGQPVSVCFELTGQGDIRLDGVRIVTITPEMAAWNKTLKEYTDKIEQLPGGTDREKQKKAILLLAVERAGYAFLANMKSECQTLLKEVSVAIKKPIGDRPAPKLSKTLLPELTTVEGNPYLESLYKWAEEQLITPDLVFKKPTSDFTPFTGVNYEFGTRTAGEDMNRYYWLVAHPQSKYMGNPELLARLFRRLHVYAEAHLLHGHTRERYHTRDFFALGPALQVMLKARETFPDLILPSDQALMDAMVKKCRDAWLNDCKNNQQSAYRMGHYANRDLGAANILLACGLYLNDQEALDTARKLVMDQYDNLYPDGAFAYIGTQNESCGYHGACTTFLTRYYHLSGQEEALDLLKRTQWYTPLSVEPGNVSDYWTAPSWKHTWNTGWGVGGETVVGLTGNRYERGLLDRNMAKRNGASADPLSAMWYRNDMEAAPLPDTYAILDRNIQGPRGRFGRFSYAATLRVPNDDEPGNATIMGAMTIEKEKDTYAYPLEAILANIMPRVFVETTPEDRHKRPNWAYLSCRDKNGVSMGQDWSALQTRYQLHVYGSSRKGSEVPWEGTQIWFGIRNRLFGLLEVAPIGEQKAFEVTMAAMLGVGGTGEYRTKDLQTISPTHWSLGSLNLALLDNNFTSLRVNETKIRRAQASQVVCSTRPLDESLSDSKVTSQASSPLQTFSPEKPYYAVVEVGEGNSMPKAKVKRIAKGDLRGLTVKLDEANYTLLLNRGETPLTVYLSSLGLKMPGGVWVHYPHSEDRAPTLLKETKLSIPPGQHRVILSGMPDAQASQVGWPNFETMIREKESQR